MNKPVITNRDNTRALFKGLLSAFNPFGESRIRETRPDRFQVLIGGELWTVDLSESAGQLNDANAMSGDWQAVLGDLDAGVGRAISASELGLILATRQRESVSPPKLETSVRQR